MTSFLFPGPRKDLLGLGHLLQQLRQESVLLFTWKKKRILTLLQALQEGLELGQNGLQVGRTDLSTQRGKL